MTDSHPPEAGASLALPSRAAAHDMPWPDTRPVVHDDDLGRPAHTAPGPQGPLIAPWLDNSLTEASGGRHDGWTPERKRLFHQTLAEVGVVSEAARAAGMSARAAYNLRNRDPLFDAGWEAALLLARRRLADDLYARAVNGVVEQIHKDGVVVVERHRYDNRLSMAVLTRLDARVDRAEALATAPANVAARWDEYLDALGADRADAARETLSPPPPPAPSPSAVAAAAAHSARRREHRELRALIAAEVALDTDWHDIWRHDDGDLRTNYPPPPGLDAAGAQGRYGDPDYHRRLTADEEDAIAGMFDPASKGMADADADGGAGADADGGADDGEDDLIHPDMYRQRDAYFAARRAKASGAPLPVEPRPG